jgi:hypothetical protein
LQLIVSSLYHKLYTRTNSKSKIYNYPEVEGFWRHTYHIRPMIGLWMLEMRSYSTRGFLN